MDFLSQIDYRNCVYLVLKAYIMSELGPVSFGPAPEAAYTFEDRYQGAWMINNAAALLNQTIVDINAQCSADIPLLRSQGEAFIEGGIDNASLEATKKALEAMNADLPDAQVADMANRGPGREPLTISEKAYAALIALKTADTLQDFAVESGKSYNTPIRDTQNRIISHAWTKDRIAVNSINAWSRLNAEDLTRFRST
jgi:hypothetical protein